MAANLVTDSWQEVREYLFESPAGRDDERLDLWESHRHVAYIASRGWRPFHLEREDVEQEAELALWNATGSWDPDRHPCFFVYAFTVIKSHMSTLYAHGRTGKSRVLTNSIRVAVSPDDGEECAITDLLPARSPEVPDIVATRQVLRQIVAAWPHLTESQQQGVRAAMNFRGSSRENRDLLCLMRARKVILATVPGTPPPALTVNGHRASREERRQVVASLAAEGLTQEEIAKRLGIQVETVQSDMKAAGGGTLVSQAQRDRERRRHLVAQLRSQGLSQRAVAKRLGVSKACVGKDEIAIRQRQDVSYAS